MAMQHSTVSDAFTPEGYGALLDIEIESLALSFDTRVSTRFNTSNVTVNFPLWTGDGNVSWVAELGTIPTVDGDTAEVSVTPKKLGAIYRVSSEMADDSNPDIPTQIAKALARQISDEIDAAFLGNTVNNGPSGLLSLVDTTPDPDVPLYSVVDTAGPTISNLDPFVSAVYKAAGVGAKLTAFIVSPAVAESLSKIKVASGSNQHLLAYGPDGLTVVGVPVIVSRHVDEDTLFWGVDGTRIRTVLRKGTTVDRSKDTAFANDAIDLRGLARVGFGFLHPASIVRGYDVSPA